MDLKKWMLSGIVAFIVMFILSYLWYSPIMGGYYDTAFENVARMEVNFLYIILGYLFYGLVMALVYPYGYKGGSPFQEGWRFGLFAGLLIWLPSEFINLGAYDLTFWGTVVDTIYHIVEAIIGGAIIGLLYGGGEAAAEAPAPAPPPAPEPPPSTPPTPEPPASE